MSYFYFDQMFRIAVSGINGTSVMPTIIQIASAILLATLLFNVYEAFVRGGDVRTLAIGAVKYLIIGLIFLNYGPIFLGVTTMFKIVNPHRTIANRTENRTMMTAPKGSSCRVAYAP